MKNKIRSSGPVRNKLLSLMLALILCVSCSGCALLALPFALVGGVLSLVQIPINLALGLVGPATQLAPLALMFVKNDSRPAGPQNGLENCDFVIVQNENKMERQEFLKLVDSSFCGRTIAYLHPVDPATGRYTGSMEELKKILTKTNMRCYTARI